MRGLLLLGGVLGVWGGYDAIADDAAHAAGPARPCLLRDVLNGAGRLLGAPLPCGPYSLTGPAVDEPAARIDGDTAAAPPRSTGATRRPAGTEPGTTVGGPAAERSEVSAPVRTVVDVSAVADVERVVEATEPVTRPVVGLASPIVRQTAGAGLLEPVGAVVRPVTQPIVEVLGPVVGPVLDLVQPIIGGPAAPPTFPGDPVEFTPTPAGRPPTITSPAAVARPALPIVAIHPKALPPPPTWEPAASGRPSAGTARETALRLPAEPTRSDGLTPASPGSTAGNGPAGGGTGAADASLRSWTPELEPQGCAVARGATLADRSRQPDTRPA
ncbi:hypothetical protein U2F26_16665 [Micromonospora sp. 4G57]|uniref:Uncharacterized protein n=1 Tax=Micromonospora sicca TaxID=2202420 RepID=A0ABU5JB53_9ACTN|nr:MULTISPECIES: hypothetical protein [unclassified Micromonospora]MDZ5444355.1 hypothetical protein [Micromonospora sp. 4G57]MDZ5489811.1 hypothetical protein [Micromonospora sp. 4G53]